MIFYTPAPLELLNNIDSANIISISLPSGGYVRAEAVERDRIRVLDLFSTDPMDYLDERLQPGRLISLKPSLETI